MPGIRDYSERGIPRAGGRESRDFEVPEPDQDNPYDREPRLGLALNGYEYDYHDRAWYKCVSAKRRTARVDHKDGTVKAGDVYFELVHRTICDETGEWTTWRTKGVIKAEEG